VTTDIGLHRPDVDNFVLVYTMGKVGSTSIARSLASVGIFYRHLQWLTPRTQTFLSRLGEVTEADEFSVLQTRLDVNRCLHALRDPEYASLIKVITAVREPIGQILSHYFHGLAVVDAHLRSRGQEPNVETVTANILECVDAYMENRDLSLADLSERVCAADAHRIHFHWLVLNCLTWFESEFLPFFPTPPARGFSEKGYMLAGNALILKFEELPTKGERAIAVYVQRPEFRLTRENVGTDRATGDLYRQVLSTIRFPRSFVAHLADSRFTRQFYNEEERKQMLTRWAA
jgi:hypothetical protein